MEKNYYKKRGKNIGRPRNKVRREFWRKRFLDCHISITLKYNIE